MYFRKIRHPSNFRFADGCAAGRLAFGTQASAAWSLRDLGGDVFHVELSEPARWPIDARRVRLFDAAFAGEPSRHVLAVDATGRLALTLDGHAVLAGPPGASLGVCGSAWLVQLVRDAAMHFYGQGEKVTGLEKTGLRTKFWNADVWADHSMADIIDGQPDPQYAAVPYLLVQHGAHWVGLLVDHPGAVFMDTGSNWFFSGRDDQDAPPSLWFGADQGVPAFYVIAGSSAAEVTQRLQRLVGTTPLPPLWALGHHQCRWGYGGTRDLLALDEGFTAHAFPNDGLWLDIDYMDRYKVFTTSPAQFGDRAAELAELAARGRKVVPILDPGVKVEAGDAIADSGSAAGIWCLNPEGEPFVGFVWPGRTWFADFSLAEGRSWWAGHTATWASWGFHGAWIDMNDPSTGAAELDDMLFERGALPHWGYHNVYATGMAEATRAGLLAARPDERPFLISRSAATGSSRYTAVWTGDNWSNWRHLRAAIPTTLNLALSGIPFNGPDVPGFGGDADAELAVAWYKAGCLFPFLRNHAVAGSARQEPWAFGAEALAVIRHHVRLRYKLLPYLYQLWLAQQRDGSAVLRPLFHDFAATPELPLSHVDDQFLVGPALMQAPLLQPGRQQRSVLLPGTPLVSEPVAGWAATCAPADGERTRAAVQPCRWFDAASGRFVSGGQRIEVHSSLAATPIYLREGSLVPMQTGERIRAAENDLADIELHVLLGRGCHVSAALDYQADDGISHAWADGTSSRVRFTATRVDDVIELSVSELQIGWRPLRVQVVGYDGAATLQLQVAGRPTARHAMAPHCWVLSGAVLDAAVAPPFSLD